MEKSNRRIALIGFAILMVGLGISDSLRGIFSHAHVARENDFNFLPPAGGKLCEAFFDTLHDPGGHWPPGSWRLSEKPGGFFRQKVAVCCAHNLCAIGAQIPHLQPEKYFLSRIYRKRK